MTKVFAHRGFSGKYPENTKIAFEKAIEAGCDGIELDVQFTRDGELIILHDETIDRTSNGTGYVVDYTLAELKELDFSAGYVDKYGINRIMTLREYMEMVKNLEIVTNIELKNSVIRYEGMEEAVYRLIQEYKLEKKVIISSFNHHSIVEMKRMAPMLKMGLLTESWILDFGAYTKKYGVECIHPDYHYLTDENIDEAKAAGREINTWTVNKGSEIERLAMRNVESVITNYPDLACKIIKN